MNNITKNKVGEVADFETQFSDIPMDLDPLVEVYNRRVKQLNEFSEEFPEMIEWLQIFFRWKHKQWFLLDEAVDYECKPKLLFKAKKVSSYKKKITEETIEDGWGWSTWSNYTINCQRWRITLYTKEHYYTISCSKEWDKPKYLGAWFGTRKPRAWESHSRWWDLADWSYSKETFDRIINDILSLEIVEIFH